MIRAFLRSIASRIFGLAALLIALMVVLVVFLLLQVTALEGRLRELAELHQPLEQSLAHLNEAGLRRRIAFERWQAALRAGRASALAEAEANHELYSRQVDEALDRSGKLIAAWPDRPTHAVALARVADLVARVGEEYRLVSERQREAIALLQGGDQTRATGIVDVLDDMQVLLQRHRSTLQEATATLLADAAREASRLQRDIVWTVGLATAVAVLLALLVAAVVTRRIVRPVRALIDGLRGVERGNLGIELPVASADEIGTLTRSFNFFVGELRQKERLRSTFGKYIDPRILDRLLSGNDSADAGGGRRRMSISFCDMVDYTSLGEALTAAGVVHLLNRHFALQAEAIQARDGVVDKFMGDAVMAFWGPPFTPEALQAVLACRAALDQVAAVERFRSELPDLTGMRRNLPVIGIRIGLSTGDVVVGNIGSATTRSYTVIGDAVNLASRIEHANRLYGTRVLICGVTRALAGDAVVAREIDAIVVKGKTEVTTVHELIGMSDDVADDRQALVRQSEAALAAYRVQDWQSAESGFRACLDLEPNDPVAQVFLARIDAFRQSPPPPEWRGIWILDRK